MCGIAGIWSPDQPELLQKIDQATDQLSNRGPDACGSFIAAPAALGHKRLSILDTSDAAAQPMTDPSGRYTLVFNGEIYNFKEIRHELEGQGLTFSSSGDTEVLLQAYIHQGSDCLKSFNGFFAFAIYDSREEKLFLARDRMGIKPLLYHEEKGLVRFASEMKALYAMDIPRELDVASLSQYLQLHYLPGPQGIYQNLKELPAGCHMTVQRSGIQIERYYHIPGELSPPTEDSRDYDTLCGELIRIMEESVKDRLVSDVPLGCFLSGGIDSSAVAALASRHVSGLKTFSIGFTDVPYLDETEFAEAVARRCATDHTVFRLSFDDLFAEFHDTIAYLDQPFGDSSALAVNILAKRTRERVTVSLSGDGGDELFAGYHKHMGAYRMQQGGLAANTVSMLGPVWSALPKSRSSSFGNRVRQLDRFARGYQLSPADRYWMLCSHATQGDSLNLLNPSWRQRVEEAELDQRRKELLKVLEQPGGINRMLLADQRIVLNGDMLRKVDLMSMAHSLEVRVPFLDHRLVNFAATLPESTKIIPGMKKRILQDAFRSILPESLYNRRKMGFEVPLQHWFRGELRDLLENDLLSEDFVREQGIFNPAGIRALLDKLFGYDPGGVQDRIYALLVFQNWWKKWHQS